MDTGAVMDVAINAMTTAIMISAPVLLISIVVGLAISIFQATTHIQEQTLTFVPKVLAIMGVLILFGPWMITVLTTFVKDLYSNMNTMFM
ncbi:MAG: flagellar biosynthesis protein FliQ [Clostridia bacterium]|nr:flagellar biosynthesis protein FliQ [Clostridia bacterium]